MQLYLLNDATFAITHTGAAIQYKLIYLNGLFRLRKIKKKNANTAVTIALQQKRERERHTEFD